MDKREEIAKVAYELYLQDGRIDGKDVDHWFEAEKIVTARAAGKKAAPGKTQAKKAAAVTAPQSRRAATGSKAAAKRTASKTKTP